MRLRTIFIAVLLALFAYFVRVHTIVNGFSLDGDECQMVNLVCTNTWSTLWTAARDDSNPPLMYLLLKLWSTCFGTSDQSFKIAALIIACAIPPAAFVAMKERLGFGRALTIGLLCCLCPSLIAVTGRVRSYGLMVLFGFASIVLFCRLMCSPENKITRWLWGVCNAALVYGHLSGVIVPAAQALYVAVDCIILRRDWLRVRAFAWASLLAAVLLVPLIGFVWYGLHGQAQPWKATASLSGVLRVIPVCVFGLPEPGLNFDPGSSRYLEMAAFWLTVIGGPIAAGKLASRYPAFPARIWAWTVAAVVLAEMAISFQIIRPAYELHMVVPLLVMLVAMATAFIGTNVPRLLKWAPLAALALLLCFWLPELYFMYSNQEPTMKNLIDMINRDVKAGESPLVVVSSEWYGPVCYRYLAPNIDFLCFPDMEKVAVVGWVGLLDRLAEDQRLPVLLEKMQARLNSGQPVYHLYVVINPGDPKKFFVLNAQRSAQINQWLSTHARPAGTYRRGVYQSPGFADWVGIDKFLPLPAH